MASDPRTIQKQIELKRSKPAFMAREFESNPWNAAHLANRAAAQELFRLIATRLPKQ